MILASTLPFLFSKDLFGKVDIWISPFFPLSKVLLDGSLLMLLTKGTYKGLKSLSMTKSCVYNFDGANALVANKFGSTNGFWDCMQTLCVASEPVINHTKTSFFTFFCKTPPLLLILAVLRSKGRFSNYLVVLWDFM